MSRGGAYVPESYLSIVLYPQPTLASGVLHDPELRGRGFVARATFIAPRPCPPRKWADLRDSDRMLKERYDLMQRGTWQWAQAMERSDTQEVLKLSPEATAVFAEYFDRVEMQLSRTSDDLKGWWYKQAPRAGRIAAILHVMDWAEAFVAGYRGDANTLAGPACNPWDNPISEQTMEDAIEIAEYLEGHFAAAVENAEGDPLVEDAVGWVQKQARAGKANARALGRAWMGAPDRGDPQGHDPIRDQSRSAEVRGRRALPASCFAAAREWSPGRRHRFVAMTTERRALRARRLAHGGVGRRGPRCPARGVLCGHARSVSPEGLLTT